MKEKICKSGNYVRRVKSSFITSQEWKESMSVCKVGFHTKCRSELYPNATNVRRQPVPDDKIPWNVDWKEYSPPDYTADYLKNQVWADPDVSDSKFKPSWNQLDGKTDRRSYIGLYDVIDGRPRNPIGRTGLAGHGCLGKWGPNHAADPVVTRWKRDEAGDISKDGKTTQPILQFVAIQRRDSGEWAFPGGMVDPGENISITLKREFGEEALNMLEANQEDKQKLEKVLAEFFDAGKEIYRGYVDDPRNTDNSWMETVAVNFHDEKGDSVGKFPLSAGDDAVGVKWVDVSGALKLYASHSEMLKKVATDHSAHW